MHDRGRGGLGERVGDLLDEPDDALERQPSVATQLERQIVPFEQLHRDVRGRVAGAVDADVIQAHDVLGAQRRDDLGLALKAAQVLLRREQVVVQHLDRRRLPSSVRAAR